MFTRPGIVFMDETTINGVPIGQQWIHYGGFHTCGAPLFMDTLICFVQKHVCPTYLIYIYICACEDCMF